MKQLKVAKVEKVHSFLATPKSDYRFSVHIQDASYRRKNVCGGIRIFFIPSPAVTYLICIPILISFFLLCICKCHLDICLFTHPNSCKHVRTNVSHCLSNYLHTSIPACLAIYPPYNTCLPVNIPTVLGYVLAMLFID